MVCAAHDLLEKHSAIEMEPVYSNLVFFTSRLIDYCVQIIV